MLLHQLLTDDEKKLIRPYLKDDEGVIGEDENNSSPLEESLPEKESIAPPL